MSAARVPRWVWLLAPLLLGGGLGLFLHYAPGPNGAGYGPF